MSAGRPQADFASCDASCGTTAGLPVSAGRPCSGKATGSPTGATTAEAACPAAGAAGGNNLRIVRTTTATASQKPAASTHAQAGASVTSRPIAKPRPAIPQPGINAPNSGLAAPGSSDGPL